MKKALSVFLSFLLVFTLTPMPAMAQPSDNAGDFVAGSSDELFAAQEPDSADGQLYAQSGLQDQEYKTKDSHGFEYWMNYDEVVKDDGEVGIVIRHIGIDRGGTDVVVPSHITDKNGDTYPVIALGYDRENGFSWFRSGNAKTVTIPATVETMSHIYFDSAGYDGVFFEAGSPIVELYPMMFRYYQGAEISLPDGLVAIYDQMFEGTGKLGSIVLPSATKSIGYRAFKNASKLTSVTFKNKLEVIDKEAFAVIPGSGFDGYRGGYYYNDGPKLVAAELPDSVTSIGEAAFRKVTTLSSLSLGTSPQTSKLRDIGARAFFGTNISSVVIPDSVESIRAEAFSGTNNQFHYDGEGNANDDGYEDDTGYHPYHSLTNLQLGSSQDASQLKFLGARAFARQQITSVTLPNSLISLGCDDEEYGYLINGSNTGDFTSAEAAREVYGKEITRFSFDGSNKKNLKGSNGAFSGCDKLETIVWPTQPGLNTIGGFDGCASLSEESVNSIPSWVSAIDDYAFYNCVKPGSIYYWPSYHRTYATTNLMNITIPATVASIGKGAFSKSSGDEYAFEGDAPTYTILNPDVNLDWGESEYEWPWPAGCGYVIFYPSSASADSDIVKYRAVVEEREAELAKNRSSYNFTQFYAVTPQSLPAYFEDPYDLNSEEKKPEADTGTLQVTVTKDRPTADERFVAAIGCNVAVFDEAGKLVDQAKTPTSAMVTSEGLAPGVYTVVGFDGNEWFSNISSLDDFARLGVVEGTWATKSVVIEKDKTTAIELPVPDLQMEVKASDVLSDGGVVVNTSRIVPDYTFYARVSYTMKDGRTASKVQVNIPEGIEPVSVNTTVNSYGIAGYDPETRVLTVEPKAPDTVSGVMQVGLRATVAGSYGISASVLSGAATVPLGSVEVNVPALELMAPTEELSTPNFTVDVYAAPESVVHFVIGNTALATTARTNKTGHATVALTIPDTELGGASFTGGFELTAAVEDKGASAGASVTQSLEYRVNRAEDAVASEQELSFEHAGQKVYLVENGRNNDNIYYMCVLASHRLSAYSPTWPFTSVLDSARPLENTATLEMKALDGTMHYAELTLAGTQDVGGGVTRYTYRGDVPVGDGDINHDLTMSDIPYAFEVLPNYVDAEPTTTFTQADVDAFKATKRHTADLWYGQAQADVSRALATNGVEPGKETDYYYQFARESYASLVAEGKDPDGKNAFNFLFNRNFEHEKWDKDGVYDKMSDADKQEVRNFENAMVELCDLWQEYFQDEKPLYEYTSMEDYLTNNFGYQWGQTFDPKQLEAEGYLVVYDKNPQTGECTWYAISHEYTVDDDGDLSAQAGSGTKGKGKLKVAKSDGSCLEKTYEWWDDQSGQSRVSQVWGQVGTIVAGINAKAIASGSAAFKEAACFGSKLVGGVGAGLTAVTVVWDNLIQDAPKYWNRMYNINKAMDEIAAKKAYYEKQGKTGTPCYQALLTEESYLKKYRSANSGKIGLSITDAVVSSEIAVISVTNPEGAVLAAAGTAAAGTAWSAGTYFAGKDLAAKGDAAKATFERKNAARKQACGEKKDPKHKARVGIDPSGYVFEYSDENRLEGITATIYEEVDGQWQEWDAADWGQENGVKTGSEGLFGWDVPAGKWKVVFAGDGYDSAVVNLGDGFVAVDMAETPALDVPPERTDIAVGLLTAKSPVATSVTLQESEVKIVFNQPMKLSVAPKATVNGVAATYTWENPVMTLNEKGAMESMSTVLRVKLPSESLTAGGNQRLVVNGGVGYSGKKMMEVQKDLSLPVNSLTMYRLYNKYTGEHFYTASAAERDKLSGVGWTYEGIGWNAPKSSNTPVYRLYNPYAPGGDHHYTTSASERDMLASIGWSYEGTGWYSDDAKSVPLYRQYNPYAQVGTHNYTTSRAENDKLVSLGWQAEGVGWYGVK